MVASATGLPNQQFFFERANSVSDSGQYRIRSASSSFSFDINGASKSVGAGLIQWTNKGTTGSPNQLWYMVQVLSGSYNLVNVNRGMQLSVDGIPQGGQVHQIAGGTYSPTEMFKLTLAQ